MAKTYHVRISGPFTASKRTRAGIEVSTTDGYTGPLTKEQIAAIEADEFLVITDGAPEGSGDENDAALAKAKEEADGIRGAAEQQAKELAEKAEADAKAQVEAAKKQADDIVAKAKEEAAAIKANASK